MSTDFRPQSDRHAGDDHPIAARHAAFSELYRAHRIDIARLCSSILHDRAEAEDATEEAFARTWRAMLEGRDEAYRYPWVRTVARHYCLDVLRKRKRTQVADSSTIETMTPHTAASDTELVAGVNAELVRASVARISESHRSILGLRDHDELSYQEIADRESVTVAVVESRLYRARRAVRREFLALSGPEGVAAGFYLRFRTRWFDTQSTAASIMNSVNDRIASTGIARAGAVGVAATTAITAIAAFGPIHVLPHRSKAAPPAAIATTTATATTSIHRSAPPATASLVAVGRNAKAAHLAGRRPRHHARRTNHTAVLAATSAPVAPAATVDPSTSITPDTASATTVTPPVPSATTSGSTTAAPTATTPPTSSGKQGAPATTTRTTDRHDNRASLRSDGSGSTAYGNVTTASPRVTTASATVAVATAPTTTTAPRQSGRSDRSGSAESDGRRGDRGDSRPSSSRGSSATPSTAHSFVQTLTAPVAVPTPPIAPATPAVSSPAATTSAAPPNGGTPTASTTWSTGQAPSSGGSGQHGNGGYGNGNGNGNGGGGGGGGGYGDGGYGNDSGGYGGGDGGHGGGWSGHDGGR